MTKLVDLDVCVQKWKVDEMVFGEMTSWWNDIAPKKNKVSMHQKLDLLLKKNDWVEKQFIIVQQAPRQQGWWHLE